MTEKKWVGMKEGRKNDMERILLVYKIIFILFYFLYIKFPLLSLLPLAPYLTSHNLPSFTPKKG